jgi:hypothetical protein
MEIYFLDKMTLSSMAAIKTTIFLQEECSKMALSDNPLEVIRSSLPLDMQLDSNFSFKTYSHL